jgi:hypothetical protein
MPGQDTPNLRAGGTIRPFRAVKASTTEDNTCLECNADESCIGVSTGDNLEFDSDNHATDGLEVRLQPGRVWVIEAGGAITQGDELVSDADGRAVTRDAGAGVFSIGVALQAAAAAGDVVEIFYRPLFYC